jgi:hypothetical protein
VTRPVVVPKCWPETARASRVAACILNGQPGMPGLICPRLWWAWSRRERNLAVAGSAVPVVLQQGPHCHKTTTSTHLLPVCWVFCHTQLLQDEPDVLAVMMSEPAARKQAVSGRDELICAMQARRTCGVPVPAVKPVPVCRWAQNTSKLMRRPPLLKGPLPPSKLPACRPGPRPQGLQSSNMGTKAGVHTNCSMHSMFQQKRQRRLQAAANSIFNCA